LKTTLSIKHFIVVSEERLFFCCQNPLLTVVNFSVATMSGRTGAQTGRRKKKTNLIMTQRRSHVFYF